MVNSDLLYSVEQYDGVFVARCIEIPVITISTRVEKEIENRINEAYQTYSKVYPLKGKGKKIKLREDKTKRIVNVQSPNNPIKKKSKWKFWKR